MVRVDRVANVVAIIKEAVRASYSVLMKHPFPPTGEWA